jgi:sec-independent protein translocase protein TatA
MNWLLAFIGMPGPMEMLIIGLVAVLLFGNRLPGVARSLGSSLVEFKKGLREVEDIPRELDKEVRKSTEK